MDAAEAIDLYEKLFLKHSHHLLSLEQKLTSNRIIYYRDLLEAGAYEPEGLEQLKESEWLDWINHRYGVASIIGTIAELVALIIWNERKYDTRYRMVLNATKDDERDGIDLIATNPNWRDAYPVQVKTVGKGLFKIPHEQWFRYPESLDRFVLVNIPTMEMIQTDYKALRYYCADREETSFDKIMDALQYNKHTHRLKLDS